MSRPPRDFREWQRAVERKLQQAIRTGNSSAITALRAEAKQIREEVVDAGLDGRQPTAPIELTVQTALYTDLNGQTFAKIIIDHPPVTKATDGTDMIVEKYELWGRDETDWDGTPETTPAWEQLKTKFGTEQQLGGFEPGSDWRFRVRGIGDTSVIPGEWSVELVVNMGIDTVAPPIPAPLVLSQSLAVVEAKHDGLAGNGGGMPPDFDHFEVAMGTTSSPTTLTGDEWTGSTTLFFVGLPKGVPHYFRCRAVDKTGNISAWSANSTITVEPLVSSDISGLDVTLQQQVTRAENAEQSALGALAEAEAAEQRALAAQTAAETAQGNATAAEQAALDAEAAATAAEATAATARSDAAAAASDAEAARLAAVQAEQDAAQSLTDLQSYMDSSGRVLYQEAAPAAEDQSENNLWIVPSTGKVYVWDETLTTPDWVEVENDDYAQAALNAANAQQAAEAAQTAAVAAEADATTAATRADDAATSAAALEAQAAAAQAAAETAEANAVAANTAAQAAEDRAVAAEAAATAAQTDADQALADLQEALGSAAQIVRQEEAPTGDLQRNGVLWIKDSTGESFTWHDVDLEWQLVDNVRIAQMAADADAAADRAAAAETAAETAQAEAATAQTNAAAAESASVTAQQAATAAEADATAARNAATAAETRATTAEAAAVAAEARAVDAEANAEQALNNVQSYIATAAQIVRQETEPTGDLRRTGVLWIKNSTGQSFTFDETTQLWTEVENEAYAAAAAAADAAADRAEAAETAAVAAQAEADTAQQAATAAEAKATTLEQQAADSLAAANAAVADAEAAQTAAANSASDAAAAMETANAADAKADAAEAAALEAADLAASKGKVWIQDTAPPNGAVYDWAGLPHASESIQVTNGVETRRNLQPNPVPAVTDGLAGWAGPGLWASSFSDGRPAGEVVASGTSTPYLFTAANGPIPVPGETYTLTALVEFPDPTNLIFDFSGHQRVDNPYFRTDSIDRKPAEPGINRYSVTFTAPADVAANPIELAIVYRGADNPAQALPIGTAVRVGEVLIEKAATTKPYFDGSTPHDRAFDLWIDTTNGTNAPKQWDGATWVEVRDQMALDAAADAVAARDAADASQTAAEAAQAEAVTAQNNAVTAQNNASAAQTAAEAAEGRAQAAESAAQTAEAAAVAAEARAATAEQAALDAQNTADQSLADLQAYLGTAGRVIYQEARPAPEDQSVNNLWIVPSTGASYVWDAAALDWVEVVNEAVKQAALDADAAADRALAAETAAETAEANAVAARAAADAAEAQAVSLNEAAQSAAASADAAEQRAIAAEANATAAATDADNAMQEVQTLIAEGGKIIYQDAEPTGDDRDPNNLWIKDSTGEAFAYDSVLADWVLVQSDTVTNAAAAADAAADRAEAAELAATNARNDATAAQTAAETAETRAETAEADALAAQNAAVAAQTAAESAEQRAIDAEASAQQSFNDLQGFLDNAGKIIHQELAPTGEDQSVNNLWIKDSTGVPHVWQPDANAGAGAWVVVTDQRVVDMAADADAAADAAAAAQAEAAASKTAADTAAAEAAAAETAAQTAQNNASAAETAANTAQAKADAAAADALAAAQDAAAAAADADTAAQNAGSSSAAALAAEEAAELAQQAADLSAATAKRYADASQEYVNDTTSAKGARRVSGGGLPVVVDSPTAMAGKAWQKSGLGHGWWVDDFGKQTFDPTVTYRIRARVRVVVPSTASGGVFYIGANGYLADGITDCNMNGEISSSNQHYVAVDAPIDTGEWVDFEGYLHGNATGTATGAGTFDDPKQMHANVRYFSPLTIIDYSAGDGTWELSHIAIDVLSPEAVEALANAQTAQDRADTAHGLAGDAQDTADIALNSAVHASKNLFSPDPPSGTAPLNTTWNQYNTSGGIIGRWQQTAGTAPNPDGTGGVDGSTWTKRQLRSEVIDNLDVGKLSGTFIDSQHINTRELVVGTSTLGAKLDSHDGTTTQVQGWTVSNTTFIDGGKIYTDSITTLQLAANSVQAEQIDVGALDGFVITGALIQTSANLTQGMKFTDTGIKGYNTAGTLTIDINGNANLITGEIMTAPLGQPSIRIRDDPGYNNAVVFFSKDGSIGTNQAAIWLDRENGGINLRAQHNLIQDNLGRFGGDRGAITVDGTLVIMDNGGAQGVISTSAGLNLFIYPGGQLDIAAHRMIVDVADDFMVKSFGWVEFLIDGDRKLAFYNEVIAPRVYDNTIGSAPHVGIGSSGVLYRVTSMTKDKVGIDYDWQQKSSWRDVKKLQPVTFRDRGMSERYADWLSGENLPVDAETSYPAPSVGFLAEQVHDVMPLLNTYGDTFDEFNGVAYDRVAAAHQPWLIEIDGRLDGHDSRFESMEKRIKSLEGAR